MATAQPLTKKGRATRDRVLDAATALVFERGVAGTTLDDVREAANVSKGQLYHYFAGRDDLIHAVIDRTIQQVLNAQPARRRIRLPPNVRHRKRRRDSVVWELRSPNCSPKLSLRRSSRSQIHPTRSPLIREGRHGSNLRPPGPRPVGGLRLSVRNAR